MKLKQFTLLLMVCLQWGCATMFHTSRQTIYVDSRPRDAKVYSEKLTKVETTPAYMNIKKENDVYLELSKEGYLDESVQLEKTIAPSFFLNLLFFQLAPVGMFIDWQTGGMWHYQDRILVALQPDKGPEASAEAPALEEDRTPSPRRSSPALQTTPPAKRLGGNITSGPRVGVTYLSDNYITDMRHKTGVNLHPFITQFGWQFEQGIPFDEAGSMVLFEIVPLVGGSIQSAVLPTVSALLGVRMASGWEGAIGPTWSEEMLAVTFSGGVRRPWGRVHVPLNLAVAFSGGETSITLLSGFHW